MVQVRIKQSPLAQSCPAVRKRQNGGEDRRKNAAFDSHLSQDTTLPTAESSITDEIEKIESSLQIMAVVDDRMDSSRKSAPSNDCSERPLTKARVRTFLQDFYEDFGSLHIRSYETWSLFFKEYFSEDYIFIRPSGNPVSRDEKLRMHTGDIKPLQLTLVSIDSTTVIASGLAAVVVYTVDQVFDFKGTINEDRAVYSCVIEQRGGEIKIVHEHRTSGRPIPKETRWEE